MDFIGAERGCGRDAGMGEKKGVSSASALQLLGGMGYDSIVKLAAHRAELPG